MQCYYFTVRPLESSLVDVDIHFPPTHLWCLLRLLFRTVPVCTYCAWLTSPSLSCVFVRESVFVCVDFEYFDSSNQFNEIIVDSHITSVLDLINSVEHGHLWVISLGIIYLATFWMVIWYIRNVSAACLLVKWGSILPCQKLSWQVVPQDAMDISDLFCSPHSNALPLSSLCPSPPTVFCISRSKECLQSSPLHCLQPASSSTEAGNSPEASCPLLLCVHKLQHLPSVHQCPAAAHPNFLLHARVLLRVHCFSHNLLR